VQTDSPPAGRRPDPESGFLVTHFLVSSDVDRSVRFYADVLGGTTVRDGLPSIVQLANTWVIINEGGGPTADKPTVILEPPQDLHRVSAFLNLRVADIAACCALWAGRGATFLTPPKRLGRELRCYMRDPDGHLLEVGQLVDV
jgi:catechol 2,3-dioxygenase-like lactoylglutathione lyase family enzyme